MGRKSLGKNNKQKGILMIKVIIFDVDGVLLDDTKIFMRAYKETGRKLKLKIPSDSEIRKLFGLPWDEILLNMYGKLDEKMRDTYSEIINKAEMKTMKDLEYFLENLKMRKAIATSKSRENLEKHLKKFLKFFEVIITRYDTKKHKPDAEPLLSACEKLGIRPEEAVYIGDSLIDHEAARNAGVNFIGFVSGSASKEDFQKLNVKFVTSLKDLLKYLS